jgi:hypothetical protein
MLKNILKFKDPFIVTIVCISVIAFLGRSLFPFTPGIFQGHDETQAGRIFDFAFNLRNGIFPPRMAPHFSYGLSYPIFNFYAPFAYWVTSLLHLTGMTIPDALKLSYISALIIGFVGMYALLKQFFSTAASLVGAVLYVSAHYFALEIFVRANISEVWFTALFPLALYFLHNSKKYPYIVTAVFLSFLFSVHNIFSLLSVGICLVYSLFTNNKKVNFFLIVAGLLISSYFLLPALTETKLTHAAEIAKKTNYQDHFLCLNQIWYSPWGFGGSTKGCVEDGLSFQLGKPQILLGMFGILLWMYLTIINRFKKTKETTKGTGGTREGPQQGAAKSEHWWVRISSDGIRRIPLIEDVNEIKYFSFYLFIFLLTLGSLFLTLPQSQFIWKTAEPILALFQFPWRFLLFIMFGLAFFGAYGLHHIKIPYKAIVSILLIVIILFTKQKIFQRDTISYDEFQKQYISQAYMHNRIAYLVPEYFPKHVDYAYLKKIETNPPEELKEHPIYPIATDKNAITGLISNEAFAKSVSVITNKPVRLNIHYFPYWSIYVNNQPYTPTKFDTLGRPVVDVPSQKVTNITMLYKQTQIQHIGNIISISALIGTLIISYIPVLWNLTKKRTS